MTLPTQIFPGFAPPTSNTTYTPNQFFDVVLPNASRGTARLVGYMLRKTLGWCDAEGNPQNPEIVLSYHQLENGAGIGHSSIRDALEEALANRYIVCVRPGIASRSGQAASTALYELRWDEREEYATESSNFQGFYAGNGNRTYIPNAFFDHILPTESLAVVRVVGVIIRNTIGYQNRYGFRRQQVAMSFTEIQRRTGIKSQTNINKALQHALESNYLQRIEEGFLDLGGGKKSAPAVYGLRWKDAYGTQETTPVPEPSSFSQVQILPEDHSEKSRGTDDHTKKSSGNHSEKSSGRFVYHSEKSSGDHSEKSSGDHSEKSSGIKIKQNKTHINKNNSNRPGEPHISSAVAVLYDLVAPLSIPDTSQSTPNTHEACLALENAGFDDVTAKYLAANYSLTTIHQQIVWLPQRKATRSRLGLLRRAIEENWQEPVPLALELTEIKPGNRETQKVSPASVFASHFYAGWAGNPDSALAHPSTNDLAAAEPYVQALLQCWPDPHQAPEWGRRFGTYVRDAEKDNPKVVRSLVYALRVHGDVFLARFRNERKQEIRLAQKAAKEAHLAQYREAYHDYLRNRKEGIRRDFPECYALFEADENARRSKYQTGILARSRIADRMREVHDQEEAQLERFNAFFQQANLPSVLGFWEWDTQQNPESFHRKGTVPENISNLHDGSKC